MKAENHPEGIANKMLIALSLPPPYMAQIVTARCKGNQDYDPVQVAATPKEALRKKTPNMLDEEMLCGKIQTNWYLKRFR